MQDPHSAYLLVDGDLVHRDLAVSFRRVSTLREGRGVSNTAFLKLSLSHVTYEHGCSDILVWGLMLALVWLLGHGRGRVVAAAVRVDHDLLLALDNP